MEHRLHDLLEAAEQDGAAAATSGTGQAAADGGSIVPEGTGAAHVDGGRIVHPRWARIVVGLTVVVLAIAAAVGVLLLRPSHGNGDRLADSTAAPPLTVPGKHPKALPGGAVGAASLVYLPCARDCAPMIVFGGGRQFRLAAAAVDGGGPLSGYALSPDGRWLGHVGPSGADFRDLTGNTTVRYADDGPGTSAIAAWSADSGWALVVRTADDGIDHFTAVRLAGPERYRVADTDIAPIAVTDDGAVLYWSGAEQLARADISTGAVVPGDDVLPDLRSLIKGGELVRAESLRLDPTGGQGLLTAYHPAGDGGAGTPVALLLVDLGDGHAIGRLDPAGESWTLRARVAGNALLVRTRTDRTEVVQLDLTAGAETATARFKRDVTVLVRGEGSGGGLGATA
jgi:hypothetical protein